MSLLCERPGPGSFPEKQKPSRSERVERDAEAQCRSNNEREVLQKSTMNREFSMSLQPRWLPERTGHRKRSSGLGGSGKCLRNATDLQ